MTRSHRQLVRTVPASAFAGFRFPGEVIVLAERWYLRLGPSHRDVEELVTERGIEVGHVTMYRWVQRFNPLLVDAARPCRHAVKEPSCGGRVPASLTHRRRRSDLHLDEIYVKVAGRWRT